MNKLTPSQLIILIFALVAGVIAAFFQYAESQVVPDKSTAADSPVTTSTHPDDSTH
jgi:hypothetical protein